MSIMGLKAVQKKKFKKTTDSNHNLPLKENLLNRDFDVSKPNKAWVLDITYIPTIEGWFYLAVVIDLYSFKVVAWSINKRMTRQLVINALEMSIKNRNLKKGLIFHSDRGSQYANHDFQKELWKNDIRSSMSRKGDCRDNAVAESFFSTLKTKLIYQNNYKTRQRARQDIFEYIAVYYNKTRMHSTLNYKSSEDYENERKPSKLCV